MKKPLPTAEYIRSILRYNPESGVFNWKVSPRAQTPAGSIAGRLDKDGYISIGVDRSLYKAHRIAHMWMTGHWPAEFIDHINGVRTDNKWSNLREATSQQNQMNVGKRSNNTSGCKGTGWAKHARKWQARIMFNGKRFHLGYFDDPKLAALAHAGASRILFGDFSHATINITINNFFSKDPL